MVSSFFMLLCNVNRAYICPYLSTIKFYFMKLFSLLGFCVLSFCALAQKPTVSADLRTQYFQIGLKTSIHYYDSLIQDWVGQRSRNTINESVFLNQYHLLENQYALQQERVAAYALHLATKPDQKPSKIAKNAMKLLNQNNLQAAIGWLDAQVRTKACSITDYLLLVELYELSGAYEKAQQCTEMALKQLGEDASLLGVYARILSINGRDSMAISIQKNIVQKQTDTGAIVAAKMDLSQYYLHAYNPIDAQSALIEAQYLLDQVVVKDEQWTINKAKLLCRLAELQLAKNDIDDAFSQAKNSVRLFDQLSVKEAYSFHEADRAFSLWTLARVYRIAGAMKEADTVYQKVIPLYENLTLDYPEQFQTLLVTVLDEYTLLLQWFDQNKAYDQLLHRTAEMRKDLMQLHNPFAAMAYAKNEQALAQKLVNVDVKVLLAEEHWLKAKSVLEALYASHPMLAGEDLCACLFKLGGIKMAFKKNDEALPIFEQSLAIRERLYRLAPSVNKKELMQLLTQTATLNANNKKYEKAIEHLQRAQVFAQELGDTKLSEQIAQYKLELLKK